MSYAMSRTTQSSMNSFATGSGQMNSDRPSQPQRDRSDRYNPPRSPRRIRDDKRSSTKYADSIHRGTGSRDISRPHSSPKRYIEVTNQSDDEVHGSRVKRQKTPTKVGSVPQTMSVATLSNFLTASSSQSSSLSSTVAVPFNEMIQSALKNPNKVVRTSEWQSGGTGPLRTSWSRQSPQDGSHSSQSSLRLSPRPDQPRLTSSQVERGTTLRTYKTIRKTRHIRGHGASIEVSDNEQDETPTQMRRNPGAGSSPDELSTAQVSDMSSQQASPEKPGIQLDLFKQLMEASTTIINEANQKVVDITIPDRAIDDNDYLSSSPASSQLAAIEAIEMKHSVNEHEQAIRNFDDKIQLRTCPMCGMEVSEAVRDRFKVVSDSLRRSYAICISHRRESTLADSKGKNYPTELDESNLAARAEKYVAILSDIINENRPSIFQEKAKAGALALGGRRMDALGQMEDGLGDLLPGYYGLKGNSVLLRVALRSSESAIRRASRRNRWITNVSITGYASAVLVPELAIRLIMEDQNVDEEKAEKIRQESIEYGRVVFGHERDVVDQSDNDQCEDQSISKKKKKGDKDKDKLNKKKSDSKKKHVDDIKKSTAPLSPKSVTIPSSVSLMEATSMPKITADGADRQDVKSGQSMMDEETNGKPKCAVTAYKFTPTKPSVVTPAAAAYEDDLAKTDNVVAASFDFLKMFDLQKQT
ncbi:RTC4-like domain-containing protein [Lipomyces doorenjongii]|uniref:RTC4-like domain-containing protein n=1 Tax=Lipomyces doorenjongii TaxID=383834 RepID=UPI0034D00C95